MVLSQQIIHDDKLSILGLSDFQINPIFTLTVTIKLLAILLVLQLSFRAVPAITVKPCIELS